MVQAGNTKFGSGKPKPKLFLSYLNWFPRKKHLKSVSQVFFKQDGIICAAKREKPHVQLSILWRQLWQSWKWRTGFWLHFVYWLVQCFLRIFLFCFGYFDLVFTCTSKMDNQEKINYEAEIDQSYRDVNLEINVLPYQFEALPRTKDSTTRSRRTWNVFKWRKWRWRTRERGPNWKHKLVSCILKHYMFSQAFIPVVTANDWYFLRPRPSLSIKDMGLIVRVWTDDYKPGEVLYMIFICSRYRRF